jgi:hypothetical protein
MMPTGHILEKGEPDYTFGTNDPTFTDDNLPHTYISHEGLPCKLCGHPEEHGTDANGNTAGNTALVQIRDGPDRPFDPTFTSDPAHTYMPGCTCGEEHTVLSIEPSECTHCPQNTFGGSAEGAGFIQKDAKAKKDGPDRDFTSNPSTTYMPGCTCPQEHTIESIEPSECTPCPQNTFGGSAEGAGFIQKDTKAKKDQGALLEKGTKKWIVGGGERDFVDPGPNGPTIYTSAPPPKQAPYTYTISSSEPSVCAHCGGSSSEGAANR